MKKIAIILFVISFAAVAYAQQKSAPYDVLIRSAKIYMGTKDSERAKQFLDSAVNNYPDQPEAQSLISTIYFDKAQYKEMMVHIKKYEEIYAKAKASGDKKLIKACEANKMPEQVNNLRLSALKKSFDEGVAQLKIADSLSNEASSMPDDSAKALKQKNAQALFDKAESLFSDCLQIDDTVAFVYTNLGLVETKKGNTQKALEMYAKSHQLNPKDQQILFTLGTTYFSLQQYDSAAVYYDAFAVADTLNREAALINEAMCYQALKEEDKLEKVLDRILEANPQNAEIHYQRGVLIVRKAAGKSIADSARTLDSLINLRPNDKALEQARANLVAYRLGFYQRALPDFKFAAEAIKTEPEYWNWYGYAALLTDKLGEAKEAYTKCVEEKPDNKDCWCQLALVYAKLKDTKAYEEANAKCEKK